MNLAKLKKIVVAVPDRLGDTLFCTPFLRLLKTSNKNLAIDILAPTTLAATTLQHNPNIATIYCQPNPTELNKIADNYDLAIDASDSTTATAYIRQINAELISPHTQTTTREHTAENLLLFFADIF